MPSLKLAIFIPTFVGGGAERVTVYLANGLAERGLPVDFVVASRTGPHLSSLSKKVRLVDLNASRVATSVFKLAKYLRTERPDILFPVLEHATIGAFLARKLALSSTRIVSTVHCTLSQNMQFKGSMRSRMINRGAAWCYRNSVSVVAVAKSVADDLVQNIKVPENRVQVIYPILTPDISSLAKEPVDDPWFGVGQPGVILGVGSLYFRKDFATLIKAFSILKDRIPHRLVILGEGVQRKELELLAKNLGVQDRVAMPGYQKNVFAYMARSSLFALTSLSEAMPMVITEALAVGTPVVSVDCKSGPREILQDGKYGLLVPTGDSQQLADAILKTLSSPRLPFQEDALRPYMTETVVSQYCQLIGI